MSTQPTASLTIDLPAIVANWKTLCARVAPARCGAVVKADAYGLGATMVVRALLDAGCREFFVALVSEGVSLKQTLADRWPKGARLHILNGTLPGDELLCLHYGLTPVLNSLEQVRSWQGYARQLDFPLAAALQVDTGMARLGLAPAEVAQLTESRAGLAGIAPTFLMSHLVSAEETANPLNQHQLERFVAIRRHWPEIAGCLANSSGIFLGADFHFGCVRPGAALYGVHPGGAGPNPMRPVLRLQAPLIQWRELQAGESVGYNHTWQASRPTRVGTIALGYADGYLRSASNRGVLRLEGVEAPLIGRVSMDSITVDLSAIDPARLRPGLLFDVLDEQQDINALAVQAGTNAYEILTSLRHRYRRHYLE
ncbi:alanine racemase [Herbaspirillum seropedicae]|uniref:alanine racemase n=1 Tax=Herbaspirillum seropedicae TaxID=964 RepID=UPI002863878F|nr:alanine racemase [Herbaspirillum seropedicae]MDR6396188.1 alanine racemase [Herbaspirillum seropedicae]